MGTSAIETERKFEAPGPGAVPDVTAVRGVDSVRPGEAEDLDATYYDTGDLRLLAHGVTLRRRTGGHDAGWHLKLPVGKDSRREVRLPLDAGPPREVPDELGRLVAGLARGGPLAPVAHLRTHRVRRLLYDDTGAVVAELAEDRVTAQTLGGAGGESGVTEVMSWQEIEVELVEGRKSLLNALTEKLTAAGAKPAGDGSKLARVLGGSLGAEAPGTRAGSAGEAVLRRLTGLRDTMLRWDPAVRRDEPDSVHKMRVATRRLRSALKSYRKVLDRRRTDPVEAELKWLAGELGRARDAEVLGERLTERTDRLPPELVLGPVRATLAEWSADTYRAAHAEAVAALSGRRYFALLRALDALLTDPPLRPAADRKAAKVLAATARREHRRVTERLDTAVELTPGPERDAALHAARKAAKRARYAGETARATLGRRAERFTRRMKETQERLGVHQDAVVTRQALRGLAIRAHEAGENGFTYGLLHGAQTATARDVEGELPALRRRVAQARKRLG
ncbi:CHAD domain-containing protein [Streptomyces sp. URMC 129]|uniref:CYTH and CHAD domain-containing protein n=1 Tax=Streptomyces sp. URMC 129 TaxID=3423407 RepID=UPI003F1C9F12